jgi:hypothetical protein
MVAVVSASVSTVVSAMISMMTTMIPAATNINDSPRCGVVPTMMATVVRAAIGRIMTVPAAVAVPCLSGRSRSPRPCHCCYDCQTKNDTSKHYVLPGRLGVLLKSEKGQAVNISYHPRPGTYQSTTHRYAQAVPLLLAFFQLLATARVSTRCRKSLTGQLRRISAVGVTTTVVDSATSLAQHPCKLKEKNYHGDTENTENTEEM